MKNFLIYSLLLLIGGFSGFQLAGKPTNKMMEVTRNPTEAEIIKYLETQEAIYLTEYDEIGQKALEGDVKSTWKMYNRYTYSERDYERAYFWAVLLERQDDDLDRKGSYIESAEGNVEAEFWSKTREPVRGTGSTSSLQDLLPEPE